MIGGNVSLYNESLGVDIDPTPVIGLLGLIDRLDSPPPRRGLVAGDTILLLGEPTAGSLAGSAWARRPAGGALEPRRPAAAHRGRRRGARPGRRRSSRVHDVAAAAWVGPGRDGRALRRRGSRRRHRRPPRACWPRCRRGSWSGDPRRVAEVQAAGRAAGVPARVLGEAGGDRIVVDGLVDLDLAEATAAWRNRLPDALDAVAR